MKKRCGFKVWGIGGKIQNGVEEFDATFTIHRQATQEEARALLLSAADNLLKLINTNQQLQPYLKEHPFSSNRIKLRLNFRDKRYNSYRDGSMESVVLDGNHIVYFQKAIYKEGDDIELIFEPTKVYATESYQQALDCIQGALESKISKFRPNFFERFFFN